MIDIGPIYRELSRRYGWTPGQIARLTASQQMMYLQKDGDDDKTVTFDSVAEAQSFIAQRKAGI